MSDDAPNWQTLATAPGGAQTSAPDSAPAWQSLATPPTPTQEPPDNSTNQEKAYKASRNMGWLGRLYASMGQFHDQVARDVTMGLGEKAAALGPAAIHEAARGVNALYDAVGANKPFPEADAGASDFERLVFPEAKGNSFSDIYHQALAGERGEAQRYSEAHPVASAVAQAVSIPATMGTGGVGIAKAALPAVGQTIAKKIGQGMLTGAELGTLGGFGQSNDESLKKDLVQTGTGAGLGAAAGGVLTAAGEKVAAPVADWVAGKFGTDAVNKTATKQILGRISASEAGGGPTAQDMLDLISANQNKPLMLADVGGDPVQGLGERIANTPGTGRQIASAALTARDAGAGQRIAGDVTDAMGSGDSTFSTEQALTQARAAAAGPAYERAGIPADPADYPNAPVVDNPKVTRLLQKSQAVQSAIAQAKNRPAYADLPDNSMVLLDKAYKNIGGAANQAKISGNGELARDLNGERTDLLDAITNGQTDHPYKDALDAFSGPSQSMDALNQGASFMAKSPDQIAAELGKLGTNDQEFYRLGAANALKTQIAKTSQGGNEALRISGNDYVKQQIRALTGSDDAADKLIASAELENKMFQTRTNTLGNSRTATRLAEQAATAPEEGLVPALMQTAAGAMTGEPVVSSIGAMNLGRKIVGAMRGQSTSPAVNAATARMLFNPNAAANQQTLARIMAMGKQPSMTPYLTRPLVQAGAQFLPGQMNMPLLSSGGGQ